MQTHTITTEFKHVSYLWDKIRAADLEHDEVALLIYALPITAEEIPPARQLQNILYQEETRK